MLFQVESSWTDNIVLNMNYTGSLFNGFGVSDCTLPCVVTQASVVKRTTRQVVEGSMIGLMFNDEVRVKKTSVDQFSFMDSLNFFGSNLGLWPGLGLHQILEWLVGMVVVTQIIGRCTQFRWK